MSGAASGSTPPRYIAHLDMDAFYASVELLRYPDLRGKPLVIGGRRRESAKSRAFPVLRNYVGRGVITTATYEARAFGLHSGMGLMKAARLAPDAILLPADFEEYRRYSRRFKDAVRAIAPHIEDRGIDEIYIDLTALVHPAESGPNLHLRLREIGESLREAVRRATGLSCSIGITPNKLLAKIASELDKPDGLTILDSADIPNRIWPLAVRKLNGIGPRAGARLDALGIHTIGELAQADLLLLVRHFGPNFGRWLHEAASGHDERPVVTLREPKSLSRETTFESDLHPVADRAQLSHIFTDLCAKLAADLSRKGYTGRTIGVKLRYGDFRTVTRERTLDAPTANAASIRRAAGECLKRIAPDRRIRLLGVRAGSLVNANADFAADPVHSGATRALFTDSTPSHGPPSDTE